MAPHVNLRNVNISIQQFQEISSGKYNAGEVRDAQTGVVTIRYSEPAGFPVKFHWDVTAKLDGTSEVTELVVDQQQAQQ